MATLNASAFAKDWLETAVPYCDPVDLTRAEKLAGQLLARGALKGFSLADMAFRDRADVLRSVLVAMEIDPAQCGTTLKAGMPFNPV